jgi:glycosyltransferase involved in cell wall biosynthesis
MNDRGIRRILHVVNQVNDRGDGIANVCVDLACEQAATGHAVALASATGGFVELLVRHAVGHYPVDLLWRGPAGLVSSSRALRLVVAAFAPDVVHAHTMRAAITARIACLGTRVPVVATVHNEYERGAALMGIADRVVGVSAAVSTAMTRRGIASRRVRTVRNGTVGSARRRCVEPDQLPRPDLPPQSIVAVGAISHRKGADVLLAAFEQLADRFPRAELHYVGNLDWSELQVRAMRSPHSARIRFAGFDPHPQRYLRSATVFALASRRDPFPLVILEALEAGTPIVATDVDGVAEALDGGRAGVLVRPESPAALADALGQVLESPERQAELAKASRRRSRDFSVSTMTREYMDVYADAARR